MVVRHGFREFLRCYSCFEIARECSSVREAESDNRVLSASLILVDPQIDGQGGLDLIHRLTHRPSSCTCVAWLQDCSASITLGSIRAGARGVVCRRETLDELALTLLAVACGYNHFSSMIASVIGDILINKGLSFAGDRSELPRRQRQVFQLLGAGMVPIQIAGRLGISLKSVQTHVERLKERLHCNSQVQLVHQAILSHCEPREG